MQIVTTLVERSAQLDVLRGAAGRVGPGAGAVALVTGEAGIGKTALVRAFAADLPPHWVVLSGGCDDLLTPRPLGPLRDVARDGPPALRAALADGSRDDLLEALLACLAGEQPTFLLIEDVHWADDATLDALRQLTRRLDRVHALVVLTCRPDDVAPGHPLQALLGDLARAAATRIPLPRLTSAGIAALGSEAVEAVLASTGGNPFFVTEVLAAPDAEVPATVVDAVLARLRGCCSPGAACRAPSSGSRRCWTRRCSSRTASSADVRATPEPWSSGAGWTTASRCAARSPTPSSPWGRPTWTRPSSSAGCCAPG